MMTDNAKTGNDFLEILLQVLKPGHYYTSKEVKGLLQKNGHVSDEDNMPHSGGNETKAYRRIQNALRMGVERGYLEKNSDCKPYQWRLVA